MSSILVVEPEPRYIERINAALGVDGWTIRFVGQSESALQVATTERPALILISSEAPGVESIINLFSRQGGGPGVVALLSEKEGPFTEIGADDHINKPFTDQELRLVVQRNAKKAAASQVMLTSHDIFGDVLAEVEAEEDEEIGIGHGGQGVAAPFTAPAPRPVPVPAPAAAPRPAPPLRDDDEINRKLERTLSGVFGLGGEPQKKAAPPPAPPKPAAPPPPRREPSGDVDAMLSRTLSTLELGRPKPAAPAPPKGRNTGAIDISALEELARPRTKPFPVAPPAVPPPPVIAAAPPPPPPPVEEVVPEAIPEAIAEAIPVEIPEEIHEAVIEAIPEPPEVPDWPPMPVGLSVMDAANASNIADAAATQRIQLPPLSDITEAMEGGERFGQYTLLEKIAAGGMAEVWKARMRGVEGFQKTVAIKKILPHMTDNSEFVGMFIDEAKLAAQLSHPNIVHIYDLGKIGRDYYIAMEYVEGKDLRSLMNAGRRKGVRMPLGLALFIAARLASALDYAHRKRDFEDREMGLVHRDVSPQNVLLSLEGDVKLCDFGIAKAVSKAGQTQMGALKGKLQYMSPEQAWGRAVDARSDLFSLGSVLYEMLTGDRLFTGDTEISVLESVRQGQIRSTRQSDPLIPVEVDEIVARALAYDPQSRFASAGEMKQRIEAVLHSLGLSPDPTDLAGWVHKVLEEEPSSGDWSAPAYPVAAPVPVPAPELARELELELEGSFGAPEWSPPPYPEPEPESFPEPEPAVAALAPMGGEVHVGESAPRSRNLLYMIIAALVVVAILTFLFLRRPAPNAPPAETRTPAAQAPKPAVPTQVAAPAPTPAPAAAAPALSQEEIEKMVKAEMARREASIRKKKEAELRKYQQELERLQADAKKKKQAADAAAAEGEPPPQ
ncbi:MAG: eukaryotic-like serine/threonine-protein kinase [Acidobacteriota bacterium]|jgi:serine/threonine protein kinase/CheY-like chemotaxis protein|nr:eukaryotic-like serine/threonine-protein kinase [Acidobacteriota bacterium]